MRLNHWRRGDGEPLLLIHGIGSHWPVWTPLLERLAAEREVIAIDLPGFGESAPLDSGRPPTPQVLADSVAAFLDAEGVGSVHCAGNSLGGWTALELARRGRALSVTALSPAGFWKGWELAYCRALLRSGRAIAKAVRPIRLAATGGPVRRAMLAGAFFGRPARIPAEAAAAAFRNLADSPGWDATLDASIRGRFEGGGEIDCPVTIAWGRRDALLLPRQAQRAADAIPGAHLVWLDGCGHVPTWDDPELVSRVLLEGSGRGAPTRAATRREPARA